MTVTDNNNNISSSNNSERSTSLHLPPSQARRRHSMTLMLAGGSGGLGGFFSGLFENNSDGTAVAAADVPRNERAGTTTIVNSGKGPTNEIIKSVNGMRHRRLGGSDIVVSELGLGTQRW